MGFVLTFAISLYYFCNFSGTHAFWVMIFSDICAKIYFLLNPSVISSCIFLAGRSTPFPVFIMKFITILSLLVVSTASVFAQNSISRTLEAGLMFGATNYSGDLAEKRVEWVETHPGFGIFARYHLSRQFSIKGHVYSGSISGDDKNTINYTRKYKFGTSIFETALVGEWTIFPQDRLTNTGVFKPIFEPYVFAGVGFTSADPKAEYYGDMPNRDLRVPLPEDGITTKYLLAPAGAGIRATITERLVLGLEGGIRPVFSDDLDGMRINGNPDNNDWYYFGGLTIAIILGGKDY